MGKSGTSRQQAKPMSLALQGGGSPGAFTWGVLDRLLEDGRVSAGAITATSAGAMNAVAFAHGWIADGPDGARASLEAFWREISRRGAFLQSAQTAFPGLPSLANSPFSAFSPANLFAAFSSFASPYDFNPFDLNPLRDTLDRLIDFEKIHAQDEIRLFIAATNVETGRVRIFKEKDVTRDAVLASACLPQVFQAVDIDGQPHWDGGYLGNPSLFPLIYSGAPQDILLVMLNPIGREGTPTSPAAIADRLNEITFNAPLLGELRAIAFVQRLLDENWLADRVRQKYRRLNVHSIRADEELSHFSHETKFDTNWTFLQDLRDRGRREAGRWLDTCFDRVGKTSTVSIHTDFLDQPE